MSFTPHTKAQIESMLESIGVKSIDDLFDEIPTSLRAEVLKGFPEALSEMEVGKLMLQRASKNKQNMSCFIGAGAYEHHIPAVVNDIISRGEFLTAYTPYQAEASQGNLQLLYEYQSMMASLTGMGASNASLYDGASGLAEAILMAVRANKNTKSKKILIPKTVNPFYRATSQTIVKNQNIELVEIPFDLKTGKINLNELKKYEKEEIAAVVIMQPNFFGLLEDVDALTNWASKHKALTIAVVNPTSLAILKEPGAWGKEGADIVCGEGQPLGVPLMAGGPYFGFICCKTEYVRQMPGRIAGKTVDKDGKPGYVLTLQAREQHIRRSKATSNICSNEGLMVIAATVYMSLLGPEGLAQVARLCHDNTNKLKEQITKIKGVKILFNQPYFHEIVLQLPLAPKKIIEEMAKENIQAGYDLTNYYPELKNALLVCCTETKIDVDIDRYVSALRDIL